MLKHFLEAYEKGYCDGLRRAQALLLPDVMLEGQAKIGHEQSDRDRRPAYREGFTEGLKDGVEIIHQIRNPQRKGYS